MTEASKEKILRIGVIQGGKIIEERLVRKRASVTVGTGTRNTLVLSAAGVPKSFTLFEQRGNDYYLAFTDVMTGRVSVGEQASDLGSLKAQNLVKKTGDTYQLKLNEASKGKVTIGEIILLFQFVQQTPEPAQPMLPASVRGYWTKNVDWPYAGTFTSVVTFFLVLIIWSKFVPLPKEDLTLADIPDRFVKMVAPDMEKDKSGDNGAGKKEAEERKKPQKKKTEEKVEDVQEEAAPQETAEAAAARAQQRRVEMEKKVVGRGLLKILGAKGPGGAAGSAVADVFKEGAVGAGDEAFEGVAGGLDVATSGGQRGSRGGDGAGEAASINELGTKGVVGNVGQAKQKAEAKVLARVTSAAMQEFDSDSRNQEDIKQVVRRRLGGIKSCYESRLKRNSELKGKVVVRFVIHPGGSVIEAEVVENTTGDSDLAACIRSMIKAIRFGPTDGGETVVVYPFILAPTA